VALPILPDFFATVVPIISVIFKLNFNWSVFTGTPFTGFFCNFPTFPSGIAFSKNRFFNALSTPPRIVRPASTPATPAPNGNIPRPGHGGIPGCPVGLLELLLLELLELLELLLLELDELLLDGLLELLLELLLDGLLELELLLLLGLNDEISELLLLGLNDDGSELLELSDDGSELLKLLEDILLDVGVAPKTADILLDVGVAPIIVDILLLTANGFNNTLIVLLDVAGAIMSATFGNIPLFAAITDSGYAEAISACVSGVPLKYDLAPTFIAFAAVTSAPYVNVP
jgi:hypothetical protein